MADIQNFDYQQQQNEDREKMDAKITAESNKFLEQIMGSQGSIQGRGAA